MAVLGALFILGLLGYLLGQAFAGRQGPPDIIVEVKEISRVETGWRVTFRARNRGGETAADARIHGELRSGGQVLESASVSIDYIPPRSVREGGLFFSRDPRQQRLLVRPQGYARP